MPKVPSSILNRVWRPIAKYGSNAISYIKGAISKIGTRIPPKFKTKLSTVVGKVFGSTGNRGAFWRALNLWYAGSTTIDLVSLKKKKKALIDEHFRDSSKLLSQVLDQATLDSFDGDEKLLLLAFLRAYRALPDLLDMATDEELRNLESLLRDRHISMLSAEEIYGSDISDELKAVIISAANAAQAATSNGSPASVPNLTDFANVQMIALNVIAMTALILDMDDPDSVTREEADVLIAGLDEAAAVESLKQVLSESLGSLKVRDQNLLWCNFEIQAAYPPCGMVVLMDEMSNQERRNS